jgi:hypothetical protein
VLGFILILLVPRIFIASDSEFDKWLDEGIEKLKMISLSKLNLTESDIKNFKPFIVIGPINIMAIEEKNPLYLAVDEKYPLYPRIGKDGFLRCSIYDILMIYLTEHHLAAYRSNYDLIRDLSLNEKTYEYYYQDIITLFQEEISIPAPKIEGKLRGLWNLLNKLVTKKPATSGQNKEHKIPKFVDFKKLRISVTNQENIEIIIDANRYIDEEGELREFKFPKTYDERFISVIRDKLKEKKGQRDYSSTQTPAAVTPISINCGNCGAPIQANWPKCAKCGAIIQEIS